MTPGAGERGPVYATRPGTPMIGPYSINQMDDFYQALRYGQVKPSGIMNYVQRLHIATRCPSEATVLDICCGRGLQLPVLYRYSSHIARYVGLDIAADHLDEARKRVAELDRHYGGRPFEVQFVECDVAQQWPDMPSGQVVIYTSALEHLPRDHAITSLRHTAAALTENGTLYLSTANTTGAAPRLLQHGVHVHEWNTAELLPVLRGAGLVLDEIIGLLPPPPEQLATTLAEQFGDGAMRWYQRLRDTVPGPFLDVVAAAAVPEVATEVLYVCSRGPR
ncbi:MAG: class I SAM-dependent methyltransferase [Pseudonocardiaceae bacterium]